MLCSIIWRSSSVWASVSFVSTAQFYFWIDLSRTLSRHCSHLDRMSERVTKTYSYLPFWRHTALFDLALYLCSGFLLEFCEWLNSHLCSHALTCGCLLYAIDLWENGCLPNRSWLRAHIKFGDCWFGWIRDWDKEEQDQFLNSWSSLQSSGLFTFLFSFARLNVSCNAVIFITRFGIFFTNWDGCVGLIILFSFSFLSLTTKKSLSYDY